MARYFNWLPTKKNSTRLSVFEQDSSHLARQPFISLFSELWRKKRRTITCRIVVIELGRSIPYLLFTAHSVSTREAAWLLRASQVLLLYDIDHWEGGPGSVPNPDPLSPGLFHTLIPNIQKSHVTLQSTICVTSCFLSSVILLHNRAII